MDNYEITVTAASGIEGVVKKELKSLGFADPKAFDGSITVRGSSVDVARLNMFLRCADRVYITIGKFNASSFDELFDGVSALPLADIFPFNARIVVNGKCRKSRLFAVSSCQSVIKKAILGVLQKKYKRKVFPENGEIYRVEFVISNDVASIYLNTSGDGLHKRGWRDLVGDAPIKETLACALLALSDFSPDRPFCDPFCGSGTIIIEAARIALGIAPGRDRSFDFSKWDFFDSSAYPLAFQEAKDNELPFRKLPFSGFDINPDALSLARRHAARAGVADSLDFRVRDVRSFSSSQKNGCIVTNPPYGERLLSPRDVASLYSDFGSVWKNLDNWSLFVISSFPSFEKYFGKKADKTRKLFNSGIECHLYSYFRKPTD